MSFKIDPIARPAISGGPLCGQVTQLTGRSLVRISGADAGSFLHNLLTQDVETLADGEMRFAALLSPPGRLLFDLLVSREGESVLLDVAAPRREALMQRLSLYKLRAKVDFAADERAVHVAWPDTPAGFISDPRAPRLGSRRYGSDGEPSAGEDDWHAHRMSLGVPDTADWPDDKTYPIEANFDLLNGIDFQKGCFVGQETTSRMKRRGSIRNRMLTIAFDGSPPPFGTEVLNGELRVGEVLSGRDGMAMALLRLDRLEGALTAAGKPVELLPTQFATAVIKVDERGEAPRRAPLPGPSP